MAGSTQMNAAVTPSPSPSAESGGVSRVYISKVKVTNFMCHDNMEVELGPYTTFIIGRNGSTWSRKHTHLHITYTRVRKCRAYLHTYVDGSMRKRAATDDTIMRGCCGAYIRVYVCMYVRACVREQVGRVRYSRRYVSEWYALFLSLSLFFLTGGMFVCMLTGERCCCLLLLLVAAAMYVQGAKAKTTKRASSMKDFIKHGCQEASVEIHFRNVGEDSFQPEIYGDTIVVHRYDDFDGSTSSLIAAHRL